MTLEPHGVGFRITELWAFLAVHDDDDEGIVGIITESGQLPLIGADQERIRSLRAHAEAAARASGKPVRLVRFSVRTDEEVIEP